MSQGHFSRHLSRMRSLYTERRKALAAALEAAMPRQLDIRLQDGGMHFVAHLRGGRTTWSWSSDCAARASRLGRFRSTP